MMNDNVDTPIESASRRGADPNELAQIQRRTQSGLQALSARSTHSGLKSNHWRSGTTPLDATVVIDEAEMVQEETTDVEAAKPPEQQLSEMFAGIETSSPPAVDNLLGRMFSAVRKMFSGDQ